MYLTINSNSNNMTTEYIKEELDNLEQKMNYAETKQDLMYILSRITSTLPNDKELGSYMRKFTNTFLEMKP